MKQSVLLSILFVSSCLSLLGCSRISSKNTTIPAVLSIQDETSPAPSPNPFPFQELTIPYLRQRSYDSTLGPRQLYQEHPNYTSYLTSYDSDGLTINALLTVPKVDPDANGHPAVVFIHGYIPPQQYQTNKNYNAYVDYLASRGIVVLKIDLRGHGQSEGDASGAYYSGDYVIDTLHAYQALSNLNEVDPTRMSFWGHSMAGNIVLRSIAAKPDIPKAVIWAGAVYTYQDFSDYSIQDSSYQPPSPDSPRQQKRDELFAAHGRFDPTSEFWQLVPATNFLEPVQTTIQLHHAQNDTVVDITYSKNLSQVLETQNIQHELFEYEDGGHNISGPSFTQAMARTAEFLVK